MIDISTLNKEPSVTPIDDGACRFMVTMLNSMFNFRLSYDPSTFDIRGGIPSGQWGMVFLASQNALRRGISVYLVSKGYSPPPTPHLLFRLFASVAGNEKDFYQEARQLEFARPDIPEDIKKHAFQCIAFVEERLGIQWLRNWIYNGTSNADHLEGTMRSLGFIKALVKLGIVPMSRELLYNKLLANRKKIIPSMQQDLKNIQIRMNTGVKH